MPRDGSQIYHRPPGTDGIPDTTIASTPYNSYVADIEQDLNLPRPIVAGGTGATSAHDAMVALGGEFSNQLVTNYDSFVFLNGSFYSAPGATSPPIAGHYFAGICYGVGSGTFTIECSDYSDGLTPHTKYIRTNSAGTWGPWYVAGRTTAGSGAGTSEGISVAGGDMFFGIYGAAPASSFVVNTHADVSGTNLLNVSRNGVVTINGLPFTDVNFYLNKPASGQTNLINGFTNGSARWTMALGNSLAESGSNAGSDFVLSRFNDAGALLGTALTVRRSDGIVTATGPIIANAGVQPVQFGGAASSGVFSDATNVAVRTVGSNAIFLQNAGGGINYAQFSNTNINLNKNVSITGSLITTGSFPGGAVQLMQNTAYMAGDRGLDIWAGGLSSSNDTTTYVAAFFDGTGANFGGIRRNGVGTVTFVSSSDQRLKQDRGISERGLADLLKVEVHDFSFKANLDHTTQGFFAQQLYGIYPESVAVGGDDPAKEPWGVDYGRLMPLAVRAIQQLEEKLVAAMARIEALEAR